jgi:hypothetical protein
METAMQASTKGLLASVLILGFCGAAHAEGTGGGGAATGSTGGTAEGNGAGQGGTATTARNQHGIIDSMSGTSGLNTMGTSSDSAQPKMDTGKMDTPASASGLKKPY